MKTLEGFSPLTFLSGRFYANRQQTQGSTLHLLISAAFRAGLLFEKFTLKKDVS
jgi:hypothetical protein